MLKKKLNETIKRWPEDPVKRVWRKKVKPEVIRGIKWLFFYTYKGNMDAFLHILDLFALGFIAWRLFS